MLENPPRNDRITKYTFAHIIILFLAYFTLGFLYYYWPWHYSTIQKLLYPFYNSLYKFALWEAYNGMLGSLYLLPMIFTIIVFFNNRIYALYSLIILTITPIIIAFSFGLGHYLENTYILFLPFFTIIILIVEIELRRRDKNHLLQREFERRQYIRKVFEAQENERQRIARELHDETLQNFLAIAKYTDGFRENNLTPQEMEDTIRLIGDISLQSAGNLRDLTLNLKPRLLDESGLVAAITHFIDTLNSERKIKYEFEHSGIDIKLEDNIEITIFRVIQEALNNINKHSQASKAKVVLEFSGTKLDLTISDDGIGFIPNLHFNNNRQIGLIGMKERVESIGGSINIVSNPAGGTKISATIKT